MTHSTSFVTAKDVALLGLLVAVATLVRVPGLTASLGFEEISQTRTGYLSLPLLDALAADTNPPMHALVTRLSVSLLDDGAVALRLVPLLAGLATVIVAWSFVRTLFGNRTAWLAATLLALSPALAWHSVDNSEYSLLVFTATATIASGHRYHRTARRQDAALFAASCIAALWTHPYAVLVVATAFFWLAMRVLGDPPSTTTPRVGRLGLLATAGTVAVGFAPVLTFFLLKPGILPTAYLHRFTPTELYKLGLIYLPHGNTLHTIATRASIDKVMGRPGPPLFDVFFFVLLAIGAYQLFGLHRRDPARRAGIQLVALWLLMPIAGTMAFSLLVVPCYIEHYLLWLAPPLCVVIAVSVSTPSKTHWLPVTALVVLQATGLWNLWVAKADQRTTFRPKSDWRAAAELLLSERERTAGAVVAYASRPVVLRYHVRRQIAGGSPRDGGIAVLPFNADAVPQIKSRLVSGSPVFLFENLVWRAGFPQQLASLAGDSSLRIEKRDDMFGIRPYVVERNP